VAEAGTAASSPTSIGESHGIPASSENPNEVPHQDAAEHKSAEEHDAAAENVPSEKKGLPWIAENTKAILTVLSSVFLSILLLALIASLVKEVKELTHSNVLLELLDVPKEFKDNGLTAAAFSEELADAITRIQRISLSNSSRHIVEPAWDQPDIQVPGSSISFRSISQWLKQKIDLPLIATDIRLSGELTSYDGGLRLIVRGSDQSVDTSSAFSTESKAIADLISKGAENITRNCFQLTNMMNR
jgi:hypothetical protein